MKTLMNLFALDATDQKIAGVQQQASTMDLLKHENVVGFGIGRKVTAGQTTDTPCLTVMVSQKVAADALTESERVPGQMEGVPTDVIEVGHLFAGHLLNRAPGSAADTQLSQQLEPSGPFADEVSIEALTQRVRPVMGGYSVGHYKVTAGTIATGAIDRGVSVPRRYYLLSNNHVLANSNDARVGDPILQPGTADGGRVPADVIGRLARWVPIRFGGAVNYVDAAVAEVPFHWLRREIFWIGHPSCSNGNVQVGTIVQKTGRTTNYTRGEVQVVNATVNVNYGSGLTARFDGQFVTTDMSDPGDSGSLILDCDNRPVGLLFAGSSTATICNPIQAVEALLGVQVAL